MSDNSATLLESREDLIRALDIELHWAGRAAKTRTTYRRDVRHFLDRTEKDPEKVTDQEIAEYLERHFSKYKSNRWNQASAALRFFYDRVVLSPRRPPTRPAGTPPVEKMALPPLLQEREILELAVTAPSRPSGALVILFGLAGFRTSPAVRIKQGSIDWEGGLLHCEDRKIDVQIPEQAVPILRTHRADIGLGEFLFPSNQADSGHLSVRAAHTRMKRLSEEFEIEFTPKTLRESWLANTIPRDKAESGRSRLGRLAGVSTKRARHRLWQKIQRPYRNGRS